MRAKIDRSGCISCGLCAELCPSVFFIAEDGMADVKADPIPPDEQSTATDAASTCPVNVIHVE